MMLDKKQSQAIFLLKFKMGQNAAETTHIISNTYGPGTAKERASSGGSRSLAKEMRALKMSSVATGHWKLIMTNGEDHRS